MAAVVEFGSEHTFKVGSMIVKPGRLFKGQVVEISGTKGEFKIVDKDFRKGKLYIQAERMPDFLFKTFHQNLSETFGVEAVCGRESGQPEYCVSYRGKKIWVDATDCLDVG